jgi:hypothetical protein
LGVATEPVFYQIADKLATALQLFAIEFRSLGSGLISLIQMAFQRPGSGRKTQMGALKLPLRGLPFERIPRGQGMVVKSANS